MSSHKIIYDLIHGYIQINPDIERVINSQSFQRLKNVKQLTAQHLYPSANHTRFEHSLGVMKLAMSFFEQLKPDLEKTHGGEIESLEKHLLFAALLHDVGHAPLSHLGEQFFDKPGIIHEIGKELNKSETETDYLTAGSPHEVMSCYIIVKNLKEELTAIYAFDYEFIFRIIVGAKYKQNDVKNAMINIVNSNTIDVDKLDYLMRDSFMAGGIGPKIDLERLLMSLCIKDDELYFTQKGLSSLQQIIDCRDNVYMWICNHHTAVYTDYLYGTFISYCNNNAVLKKEFGGTFSELLFSCDAISKNYTSDNEALYFIKKAIRILNSEQDDGFARNIITQLETRHYLKPTWKTLYEYSRFMKSVFPEKEDREQAIAYIVENSESLIAKIRDKLHIEPAKLFFVSRQNKFYYGHMDKISINVKGEKESLSNLLPPRNYAELYEEVAFYLFCEEANVAAVKAELKRLLYGME
ncbi:dGTP triphosphohydrolase [Spirochaetia bacterium]|nr:dGTP triphosphohydrolase [Spirochaetia bacterium]